MKRIITCLALGFIVIGFLNCMEIPNELKSAISLKEEYQGDNYYDRKWRVQNGDLLYHPDGNALGLRIRYKTVDIPRSTLFGTSIFTDYKIIDIKKSKDDFVITNKQGDMGKQTNVPCYFVKVQYSVIAYIISDLEYEIYKTPKEVEWYWVFVADPKDGQYKLYDELPSFRMKFSSLSAFSAHVEEFSQGEEILKLLEVN